MDRYVRPCVRGSGARREVHKLQFESIAPIGSVGYFLSPAPCSGVGPTFLPRARVAGRGGCADVLCVSVVSEVKLPGSSPATIATKANHMMYTGTANPVAYCILVRFRFNQLAEWIHLALVGNWRFCFARSHREAASLWDAANQKRQFPTGAKWIHPDFETNFSA